MLPAFARLPDVSSCTTCTSRSSWPRCAWSPQRATTKPACATSVPRRTSRHAPSTSTSRARRRSCFSGCRSRTRSAHGLLPGSVPDCASWPDASLGRHVRLHRMGEERARLRVSRRSSSCSPSDLDARELLRSLIDAFTLFLQPGHDLLDPEAPAASMSPSTSASSNALHPHQPELRPRRSRRSSPSGAPLLTPFLGTQATEAFIARRECGAVYAPWQRLNFLPIRTSRGRCGRVRALSL